MDTTQILAIYGALASSILLLLRFKDRDDKKRKMLVRIDRFVEMNQDTYNYHNGRKGNQYIRIRITNQSENPNAIEKVELNSTSKFLRYNFNIKKVTLTFDHDYNLPFGLVYSSIATGYIFIHMDSHEFHKSWKSNFEILKGIHQKYIFVKVHDTQGKKFVSNMIKLSDMLKEFLETEMKITTKDYFEEEYNKTSS